LSIPTVNWSRFQHVSCWANFPKQLAQQETCLIFAMILVVFPPDLEALPEQSSHGCCSVIAFASPRIPNKRETKAASEGLSQTVNDGLLNSGGNRSYVGAKSAHMVGHLPGTWHKTCGHTEGSRFLHVRATIRRLMAAKPSHLLDRNAAPGTKKRPNSAQTAHIITSQAQFQRIDR